LACESRPAARRWRRSRLLMGVLGQALALRASFARPSLFWPALTASLTGSGLLFRSGPGDADPDWDRRWLVAGAVAGIFTYLATVVVAICLRRSRTGATWLAAVAACTASRPPLVRSLLVVPAAIGEEHFWREHLLADGLRPISRRRVVLAAVLYSLTQTASGNPLPVAGGLVLGGVTGSLRRRSRSLAPALAAHLVFSELTLAWPGLPEPARGARQSK